MPLKSVTIRDPNAPEEEKAADQNIPVNAEILERPLHDTGNKLYAIASFFLPPVGIIAGLIFKKFRHIRNYKACLKGAIAGLCTLGAVVGIFLLALLLAVI